MKSQPSLETERLLLRPLELSDASSLRLLAGDYRIAEMNENIPNLYEEGMAENWIQSLHPGWEAQEYVVFAICLKNQAILVGCCGLTMILKHNRATLGFWIGADYWRQGLCTEAVAAVVEFGFDQLKLHRIEAQHLTRNAASGAVMQKIGMKHETTMHDYVLENYSYEDMELYSILA